MGAMIIRNRIVSVLLRVTMFALYVFVLCEYLPYYDNFGLALSTFSLQIGLVVTVMVGLEIIYNLIDLRRGIHGASAGPHMKFALPITVFCVLGGVFYFTALLPNNAAPGGLYPILFHVFLIVLPLLDWILLDEKGTVRYSGAITCQIYPILYFLFGYFRTLIWPNTVIYGTEAYALPFLAWNNPNIVGYAFAFFGITIGANLLAVFINSFLAGNYGFFRERWD